jgi:hypothetical protein
VARRQGERRDGGNADSYQRLSLRPVRYQAETDLAMVLDCNCSFCQKRGALWISVGADQFTSLSGKDDLTDYQFNRQVIHHLFCRNCGVGSFSRGENEEGGSGLRHQCPLPG